MADRRRPASDEPVDSGLLAHALDLTHAAGSATLWRGNRLGGVAGERADEGGLGVIDFRRRTAAYRVAGPHGPYDVVFAPGNRFVRVFDPDEPWMQVAGDDPADSGTPLGSPFWILEALHAFRDEASLELVGRNAGSTDVELMLPITTLSERSEHGLAPSPLIWNVLRVQLRIDASGRLERVASVFPIRSWRPGRRWAPQWTAHEFSEYGRPVEIEVPHGS